MIKTIKNAAIVYIIATFLVFTLISFGHIWYEIEYKEFTLFPSFFIYALGLIANVAYAIWAIMKNKRPILIATGIAIVVALAINSNAIWYDVNYMVMNSLFTFSCDYLNLYLYVSGLATGAFLSFKAFKKLS